MSLGDEDAKSLIISECGDPNHSLSGEAGVVARAWEGWSDKQLLSWDLRFLYTKRSALDARLAEESADVDYQVGTEIQPSESQYFDHLKAMWEQVQAEIERIEQKVQARALGSVAKITASEPALPRFPNAPDANDDRYRGSPYRRTHRSL